MKLSVSTYSLSRWRSENNKTLEDSIDWIAEQGVDGVEFSGLDPKAETQGHVKRAKALRKRVEKHGLVVSSYCVGANLLVAPDERKKVVDKLKGDVDTAAAFGVRTMRHDVAWGWGEDAKKWHKGAQSFAAALKAIVPAIREVTEYAQTQGVKTSLENHGFYMQASERVEKLIKAVDHPNYGLTIDMGNFLCVNENPVDAVKRVGKYAIMAHVKDFHIKPKKLAPPSGWIMTPTPVAIRGAIVGHGGIDIPAQLKILKRLKYNHFLSLEFEGLEEPTRAIKLGLEYLRLQFKELGIG